MSEATAERAVDAMSGAIPPTSSGPHPGEENKTMCAEVKVRFPGLSLWRAVVLLVVLLTAVAAVPVAAQKLLRVNGGDGELSTWPGWTAVDSVSSAAFLSMSVAALSSYDVVEIGFADGNITGAAGQSQVLAAVNAGAGLYHASFNGNVSWLPSAVSPAGTDGCTDDVQIPAAALSHPIITFADPDITSADLSNVFCALHGAFTGVSADWDVIAISGVTNNPAMLASNVHRIFLRSHHFHGTSQERAQRFVDSVANWLICQQGVDDDNDGVDDCFDNCLGVPNADQSDADADAAGDACDDCPLDPDDDLDGDGVCGDVDNCPEDANAGQADGDGDGVGDLCDNCPGTPNPDTQDATAACIGVSPADALCMEAQVELISEEPTDGEVTVEQITTHSPVSFTKANFSSDVDVIDTNLRITRGCCGGVFNQGSDQTAWAVGTCAAPTSQFYSSHSQMISIHFRPVDQNLPGSDTCLHDITTDTFYDVRWDSWSCCAQGGFAYTRTQAPSSTALVTVPYTNSTLPEEVDISTLAGGDYFLCVSAETVVGGEFDPSGPLCTCGAGIQSIVSTEASVLDAWNAGGPNDLRFVKLDNTGSSGNATAWARAVVASGASEETVCVFDFGGGSCTENNLCSANYTFSAVDATQPATSTFATVDSITFEVLNTDCNFGDKFQFFLNDQAFPVIEVTQDCSEFTKAGEDTIVINGSCNQPPVCSAAGPAGPAECAGATTAIAGLDGSASSDPDGDAISFSWATDCTGGLFDATTSATPTLTVDSPVAAVCPGPLTCNATLTVTDIPGGLSDTCAANAVSVDDTVAPVLTVDTTPITVTDAECSGDEPAALPTASASDQCDPAVPVGDDAPGTFPAGQTTTVTYTATDDCSNSSTDGVDVTVLYGADIAISANKHTVGGGTYPGSNKEPLVGIEVCAYDKAEGSCSRVTCGGISHQHYQCILDTCDPVNAGFNAACCTTDANGECTINAPPGDYIVISGDATKTVLPDPLGVSASDLVCGELKQKHLQQIVRNDGKKMPGKTTRKTGSELLIIEPEFVEWSETTEEYPVVFQSIGTWDADSSVEPPEGFVSDYDSLAENVDNELEAVQFVLTDIGSEWVPTGTRHDLRHNGRKQVVLSRVGVRVAEGLAKAKGLDRDGHPLGPDGKPKPHPGFDPRYEWPVEIAGWIEPSAVDEGWTLNLRVNRATDLELAITRGQGKIVKLLGSGSYSPGEHAFSWDSDGLDKGKYFLRLTAGELVQKVELLEK